MNPDPSLTLMPYGWPVIIYMALAGIASGACLLGCLGLLSPTHTLRVLGRQGLLITVVSIFVGAGFLVLDLEEPSRFWLILAHFNPSSVIAWGARAIAVFGILCTVVWFAAEPKNASQASNRHVAMGFRALVGVLILLALTIALYPAFVLRQAVARPLWANPFIVPIFFTSAIHTGMAALTLLAAVHPVGAPDRLEGWFNGVLRSARRAEVFLILLQSALVLAFVVAASDAAALQLTSGGLGVCLWAGIIFVGWLLPLGQMALTHDSRWSIAARGTCVLVGGFSLRAFIILGGQGAGAFIGSQG